MVWVVWMEWVPGVDGVGGVDGVEYMADVYKLSIPQATLA